LPKRENFVGDNLPLNMQGLISVHTFSALCHYNLVTGTNKQFYSILNY